MAKKAEAKSATETQRRRVGKQTADAGSQKSDSLGVSVPLRLKSSSLLDTRVVYCGDNLEQLAKLPDASVDLIYIDPPFNSNRNYGPCRTGHHWGLPREITPRVTKCQCLRRISRGETKEKRAFEDRHENTKAYIDYLRPRCVQLARVLKQTGSFYYHCDWHASHYVKVMLDQILGNCKCNCA
jgi:DNA modification methylase